jgi:hypothetical protein
MSLSQIHRAQGRSFETPLTSLNSTPLSTTPPIEDKQSSVSKTLPIAKVACGWNHVLALSGSIPPSSSLFVQLICLLQVMGVYLHGEGIRMENSVLAPQKTNELQFLSLHSPSTALLISQQEGIIQLLLTVRAN